MTAQHLYIAQHGLALSKEEAPERPLSPAGTAQTEAIARHLQAVGMPVSRIFHSGKLRAEQTARIFADRLGIASVSAFNGLLPNDPVSDLIPQLDTDHGLYIGHLPQLQKLTDTLLTGDDNGHILQFINSAVICLERAGELYRLRGYLTPELVPL